MATYEFRYRLNGAPQARNDGSGQLAHDIEAECREAGSADPWVVVPSHHQDILLPSAAVATVMAMPHATNPQKTAKNTAYKQLLVVRRASPAAPLATDWSAGMLQTFLDQNDAAVAQTTAINTYITVTLAQNYPVPFTI